jgi:hypothetical protein
MERYVLPARRRLLLLAAGALCLTMTSGCGDPVDRLLASDAQRTRLWDTVAGSPDLSGQVVDRLLSADSTRAALLDRVMGSGGARQAVLMRVATDRNLMEGTVLFAVQDTAMRAHLMTLFRGMEMGSGH